MVLVKEKKAKLINDFKVHARDTGSAEVQVSLLSEEIKRLTFHLKKHQKDNHSRRGLLMMVAKRKRLLDSLKRENEKRYNSLIKKLDLKK